MFEPLDGPSKQLKVSVTTSVAVEVKVGATALDDRKVITLQPLNGSIKVYMSDGTVPSAATVSTNGMDHYKSAKESYEAGDKQRVFIVAASGTVDVVMVERA
jgi:hypothetical protein